MKEISLNNENYETKIDQAWKMLDLSVGKRDIKKIIGYAMWIKRLLINAEIKY
jgi:hypothetical protein